MIIKHVLTLLLYLMPTLLFCQETTSKIFDNNSEESFLKTEKVPVYNGCEDQLSNIELKKCMSNKISSFISKKFNTNVASSSKLVGKKVKINILFKIDTTGKIINIMARAPSAKLEKEAIRVVSMLPDMVSPGMRDGKAVNTPYFLPILVTIDKKSKKRRNLKKLGN